MTFSVKHSFTSAKADGVDATLIQPSNWNAEHTLTAAAGKVLGRDTSGAGVVQELPIAVTSSGDVGLGTSSPNAKVDVQTTGAYSAYFQTAVDQASNVAARRISLTAINFRATVQGQSLSGTWGADDLLINPSGGNVGIGYSDPKTRLQITAGVNLNAPSLGSATNAPLYVTNTDTTYGLLAGTNASDGHVWLQAQRTDGTATAYNLTLNEAGGNVGIGTTSPAVALDVQKAAASQIRAFETGSSVDLRLNAIGGAGLAGIIGTYSNHPVVVYANTTEAMRITSAGNVGIGTSSPQVRVHISTVDQSTNRLRLQNTGTGGGNFDIVGGNPGVSNAGLGFYDVTNAATRMYIDSAGNVGIGTSSPGVKLEVRGDVTATNATNGVTLGTTDGNIELFNSASTAYIDFKTNTSEDYDCRVQTLSNGLAFFTGGNGAAAERVRIDSAGNLIQQGGVYFKMTAPASKSAAATLTGAEVVQGYIQYTGAAANLTLPTATNLQAALPADVAALNDIAFDFTIINTGSGTATLVVNTGITAVGALTTAINTATTFHIRKTATNTFIVYRT